MEEVAPCVHSPSLCMNEREQAKDGIKQENNPVYRQRKGRSPKRVTLQSAPTKHDPLSGAPCSGMVTGSSVYS